MATTREDVSGTPLDVTLGGAAAAAAAKDDTSVRGKPSEEEIARRRAAKQAAREQSAKSNGEQPQKQQQPQKKKSAPRDPEAESAALREWAVAGTTLIDIGANLHGRGEYEDVVRQVDRAAEAGVSRVVLTGCDEAGSAKGRDVCERWAAEHHSGVATNEQRFFFTAGVHPHEASAFSDRTARTLESLYATSPLCVALGECGLDYDRMLAPRETQLAAFRAQAELAARLDAPLFVHCREKDADPASVENEKLGAYRDAVAVLRDAGVAPHRACVHCFTGDAEDLDAVLDFGAFVGLTGFVAIAKRSAATRAALRDAHERLLRGAQTTGEDAAASAPGGLLARLMIETDAPFMLPDKTWLPASTSKRLGLRGGRNEPAVLPAVARAVAAVLDTPVEAVARATTANAEAFFRFPSTDGVHEDDAPPGPPDAPR